MINRHSDIAAQLLDKTVRALKKFESEEMTIKDIRECIKLGTDLERISQGMAESDIIKEQEENKTSFADVIVLAYLRRKENSNC